MAKDTKQPTAIDEFLAKLGRTRLFIKLKQAGFTSKEQQAFLEDFAILIDDGVTPYKALNVIVETKSGNIVDVATAMMRSIGEGKSLSLGMKGWFPQFVIELISAGESGGSLNQTLHSAADALAKRNSLTSAVLGSLSYPLVVIIMGLWVTVYIKNSVFIQFEQILPVEQWPVGGRRMLILATFLEKFWWVIGVAILAIMYGYYRLVRDYVGGFRDQLDKLPLIKIYRQMTAARFMETMGLLISNGVVFKKALKIIQEDATSYLGWHLILMEYRLGRGKSNIADVLDTAMIDRSDIVRLRAIADAKGFEHALVRFGKQAAQDATAKVTKAVKILGGIMLGVGAGLAGYIVVTIYSVGNALSLGVA